MNQHDNYKNSKQRAGRPPPSPLPCVGGLSSSTASEMLVGASIALLAVAVLAAASILPQPLAGRLHPAHVPAVIALIALVAVARVHLRSIGLRRKIRGEPPACANGLTGTDGDPGWRVIASAVVAVIILALATRTLGVLPAVCAAGAVAASGVRGVGLIRACGIGAGLALLSTGLFVGVLRQPLPILPGWW